MTGDVWQAASTNGDVDSLSFTNLKQPSLSCTPTRKRSKLALAEGRGLIFEGDVKHPAPPVTLLTPPAGDDAPAFVSALNGGWDASKRT